MTQTAKETAAHEKALHLEDIIETLREYRPDADVEQILAAYAFASKAHKGQTRLSGEPYLSHPMEVANLLTRLNMDQVSIAAALLHDTLEDTNTTAGELEEIFGKEITKLVEGLTKLARIRSSSREERQAENVRKMILATSDDIRIVLIKLADRLHNLRTLEYLKPSRQKAIAEESMDIYAPLANRLGIGWVKREMEDISFMYLHPKEFKKLTKLIKERKEEMEKFALTVANQTYELLMKEHMVAHVTARPKHIYSIYKKMQEQSLEFRQIYDIIGVRIITNSVKDCYTALGLVHSHWKPIQGKFKDYIALPKDNMYQSIHTAVLSKTGRFVEYQIRTQQMHRHAEEGIAAHWRYKEDKGAHPTDGDGEDRFIWLRRLMELGHSVSNSMEFLENVKIDLYTDEVYVFTPKQEVYAFPAGATPLDFAYAIHTQVGHNYAGAMINGQSVPMETRLENGDVVEIITAEGRHPSPEWLKIVKTSMAKSKIRAYLRVAEKEEAKKLGIELVREELKKYNLDPDVFLTQEALKRAAETLGFKNEDLLLKRLGFFKMPLDQFLQKLLPINTWQQIEASRSRSLKDRIFGFIRPRSGGTTGIRVGDHANLLIRLAGCCNPVPGDSILGFISSGHGMVIHNKACPVLKERNPESEQLVEAQWEKPKKKKRHAVRVLVKSINQPGILARVTTAIADGGTNISNAVATGNMVSGGELDLTVEIEDLNHLRKVIDAIKTVKGVKKVERYMEGMRKVEKR
ncbi:MAG: RelA/SpoT family protein [Nitrospinota bacterium]